MIRKHIYFSFLFLWLGCLNAFASQEYDLSILTCAPGDELYSVFGHTALRIANPSENIDLVFNFGVFDFQTPNFYPKFIRGDLDYFLDIEETDAFIQSYTAEHRAVFQQTIQLSAANQDSLLQRLQFLSRPENRYYKYKFSKKKTVRQRFEI